MRYIRTKAVAAAVSRHRFGDNAGHCLRTRRFRSSPRPPKNVGREVDDLMAGSHTPAAANCEAGARSAGYRRMSPTCAPRGAFGMRRAEHTARLPYRRAAAGRAQMPHSLSQASKGPNHTTLQKRAIVYVHASYALQAGDCQATTIRPRRRRTPVAGTLPVLVGAYWLVGLPVQGRLSFSIDRSHTGTSRTIGVAAIATRIRLAC